MTSAQVFLISFAAMSVGIAFRETASLFCTEWAARLQKSSRIIDTSFEIARVRLAIFTRLDSSIPVPFLSS
ncbi:hypothetical protein V1291_004313 [Nitrobacteraceae bacterium AZCC 1564]